MSAVTVKKRRRHEDDFIKRSRGEKIFNVCNIIFMLLLLIFLLYPVLNVISISVSNETQVMAANVTFYPIGYNPQAYTTIFKDNELWHSPGLRPVLRQEDLHHGHHDHHVVPGRHRAHVPDHAVPGAV